MHSRMSRLIPMCVILMLIVLIPQSAYAPKKKPLKKKAPISVEEKTQEELAHVKQPSKDPDSGSDDVAPAAQLEMKLYVSSYNEIVEEYNHYLSQSSRYGRLDFSARLFILLASVAAAILLAISSGNTARKLAIVLILLVSGAQAADEAFKISLLHQISYRTALDLSRLLQNYRIEVDSADTQLAMDSAINKYREQAKRIIDKEIDISLGPVGPLEVDVSSK